MSTGPGLLVTVAADADAVAELASARIEAALATALAARGSAHMSLAGGSTPRATYGLLARRVERWEGVELWFGDERVVAADDPHSTYAMVMERLATPAGLDPGQVHRVLTERGAEAAAAAYAAELRARVPADADGTPLLDLALLGLGEDGHVASLFPHHPALAALGEVCVAVDDAPKPPPLRVTLTLDVLTGARSVLVLATGEGKAAAVREVMAGPSEGVPGSLLAGAAVELVLDEAAADGLDVDR